MRFFFFFQAEDGIRDLTVTGVQTCALPIWFPSVLVRRVYAVQAAQQAGPGQACALALGDLARLVDRIGNDVLRDARELAAARLRQDLDAAGRSEEHTSELQSQSNLVCRLLLEKKK